MGVWQKAVIFLAGSLVGSLAFAVMLVLWRPEWTASTAPPPTEVALPAPPVAGQRNLADDPAHAATRAELEALLLAEMRRHDDPYRFSDQPQEPSP